MDFTQVDLDLLTDECWDGWHWQCFDALCTCPCHADAERTAYA